MHALFELIRFLRYAAKEIPFARMLVLGATFMGVVAGFVGSTLIGVLNAALTDQGASGRSWAALFFGLCLMIPLTRFLSQGLLVNLTQQALAELRVILSKNLLRIEISALEMLGQNRLFTLVTTDVDRLAQVLAAVPIIIMNLALVTGCALYLSRISIILLGISAGFILVSLFVYVGGSRFVLRDQLLARRHWDVVIGDIRALIYGSKELKLNLARRTQYLSETVQPNIAQLKIFASQAGAILSLLQVWAQFAFFVLIGLLAFVFGPTLGLTPPNLTAFILTLVFAAAPIEALLSLMPALSQGVISLKRLQETGLHLLTDAKEVECDRAVANFSMAEFRDVRFAYPAVSPSDPQFTLGPINLQISRGNVVFLTGANGAGKTTLLKLVAGLYPPDAGSVTLDGRPTEPAMYREQVSAVFSDTFVFAQLQGTALRPDDRDARQWMQLLDVEGFVSPAPPWRLREDLSQGQRMRLALLVALLEDRPIVLLDEWAAHQQPSMRQLYYRTVLPELRQRGKAVVAVSHDEAFFHCADRLITLDYGLISTIH